MQTVTIKNLTKNFGDTIALDNLSLNIEKGKIIHDSLIGSKLHLQRVFINIINNAIKYNKKN